MTNTNAIHEDVLGYIAAIDDVALESEMAVTLSLMEAADKAMMIMENYEGDYIDSFSIFQEATGDGKDPKHPFKEDGVLKTIIMAPVNLIKLIIAKLKKLFGKEEMTKREKAIQALKSAGNTANDIVSQACEIAAGHKKELVIGGITISAVTLGLVTGKIQALFGKMRKVFDSYSNIDKACQRAKEAPMPTIVYKDDDTYVSTVFDLNGMIKCSAKILNSICEYKAVISKKFTDDKTKDSAKKDVERIQGELRSIYNEFKTNKGYVKDKPELFKLDVICKEAEQLGGITETVDDVQKAVKTIADESYSDTVKKLVGNFNEDLKKIGIIANLCAEVVAYHTDMPLAVVNDLTETGEKGGFGSTIKSIVSGLFSKVKSVGKSGDKGEAESGASDGTGEEQNAANADTADTNATEGDKTEEVATDSAKIDVAEGDETVQESAETHIEDESTSWYN